MELRKIHVIIGLIILALGFVVAGASVFVDTNYNENSLTNVSNVTLDTLAFNVNPSITIEANSTCITLTSSTVDFVIC